MGSASNEYAPKVNISSDGMEAKISLRLPGPDETRESYTSGQLLEIIKEAGVTFGVDKDAVAKFAANPVYDKGVLIATGIRPKEGIPGHYNYNFDLSINKKPTIRPDGSTDYMNIKMIEVVHKDDVIATYEKAVQGTKGMTVRGQTVEPKPVRDLPPLTGRGFDRSHDGMTYTSIIDGKIEMNGNRILISAVHEVNSDVDIATGNIDFNGDVVIHGGASDGVIIKAAGDITIDGLVENCEIYAGKDLYLLSGVKGGERTVIDSGANITAQFIEYAIVNCGGDFTADYIFKSRVSCDGKIILNGNKSAIIGGNVSAVQGIDVNEIGNDFGTITNVSVGIDQDRMMAVESLSRKISGITQNVEKIKRGLEDFEKLGAERGTDYKDDPRRLQLLRVKIRDEAVVVEEQARLEKMRGVIEKGNEATIRVFNKVYPGVNITIDDHHTNIKDDQTHVEFVKTATGVKMEIIEGM